MVHTGVLLGILLFGNAPLIKRGGGDGGNQEPAAQAGPPSEDRGAEGHVGRISARALGLGRGFALLGPGGRVHPGAMPVGVGPCRGWIADKGTYYWSGGVYH